MSIARAPGRAPRRMTPAQVKAQRDRLLERLERLVRMGYLGQTPGAYYVEIGRDEIDRADAVCKRARAAMKGEQA